MKIGIVQLNTIVGDVENNLSKAVNAVERLVKNGADTVVLTELFFTGYPPKDLLDRKDLINNNLKAVEELTKASETYNTTIVCGFVETNKRNGQKKFFNAAFVAQKGKIVHIRHKSLLPTYDVFSEDRYFEHGDIPQGREATFEINGTKVGLVICEEAWNDAKFWNDRLYSVDPVEELVKSGAEYIISINASPYRMGVQKTRRNMFVAHAKKLGVGFCYVNQVGYNDDVGFDGSSFLINKFGEVTYQSPSWREDVIVVDTEAEKLINEEETPWQADVLQALTTGVRDYWNKLGIKGPAIIGLSGGIDSALVAYIAVQALGRTNVIGVGMPSEFSSDGSVSDAEKIAKKLGIHFHVEPIKRQHEDFRLAINNINIGLFTDHVMSQIQNGTPFFGRKGLTVVQDSGVTDENLQARIRGIYLMGIANYYSGIVLSTGNKSETAVGYCTIYGDMCGGLAVISDLYKTKIFEVCKWINETHRDEIIPWNTIEKPPSAELRKNQRDQDSLPPYKVLDSIIEKFVEESKTADEIVEEMATFANNMDYRHTYNRSLEDDIYWVCQTIIRNEFKRKQAATGLKITSKLFKCGWEMPVVHRMPIRGKTKEVDGASASFPVKEKV